MPNFLKFFDGSGRTPRDVQITACNWLEDNWHSTSRFGISAPVGSGKSAISMAVAKMTDAHIITPSNLLIDQYTSIYPRHNALKGRAHYQCKWGMSCQQWHELVGEQKEERCEQCPYIKSKVRSYKETTIFNPMSLYYATQGAWQTRDVIIVDEAHQLPSMLMMLSGARLRKSLYRFPITVVNENYLVGWLEDQIRRLEIMKEFYKNNSEELKSVLDELEPLRLTTMGLMQDAQNYAVYLEKGKYRGKADEFLCIKPLSPPRYLVDQLLDARKVILMSGTLMKTDMQILFNDQAYKYIDLPSPIPKERRAIQFKPVPFKMNQSADPKAVVKAIEQVIAAHPKVNTIIHVSYSASKRLAPHFTIPILFNDQTNKDKILAQFKEKGGVFLAAGCAEGIDLKGDLCRLNIIPQLAFPNLVDITVQKRKALADGQKWYSLETMKTTIQQAGRSTRDPADHSLTVILDPNFAWVFKEVKADLPASFKESIRWV